VPQADLVLCVDVLIHQKTEKDYRSVIDTVCKQCSERLIITGFNKPIDESYMIGFHERLTDSLKPYCFDRIVKVFEYNNTAVFVADKKGSKFSEAKPVEIGQVFSVISIYLMRQLESKLFE